MTDHHKDAAKRLKADTVAARTKRKHDLEQDTTSLLPWKSIAKRMAIGLAVAAALVGGYLYVRSRPVPPKPIDWDRCPVISELVGTVVATRDGKPLELTVNSPVPPGTQLKPEEGGTMALTFTGGTSIGLYPGSRAVTDPEYRTAITLEAGPLFVSAKEPMIRIKTIYGSATCRNTLAHFDLARSRFRGDCETGEVIMTNAKHNRKLRIRPSLPGEVGIGADFLGLRASEEDEAMAYPKLEVASIGLINADKDVGYPSFNPLRDGAIFVKTELTPKAFDFKVMTNSANTVRLAVTIQRMENDMLAPVHTLESLPVTVRDQKVFGVFGIEKSSERSVAFKGNDIPVGDYLMTITPYGPPRNEMPGKGRGVTIRFSMVE